MARGRREVVRLQVHGQRGARAVVWQLDGVAARGVLRGGADAGRDAGGCESACARASGLRGEQPAGLTWARAAGGALGMDGEASRARPTASD